MLPEEKQKIELEIKNLWEVIRVFLSEIKELEDRRVYLINLLKEHEQSINSDNVGKPSINQK